MRTLVVYCHPRGDSYTAAVRDVVLTKLRDAGTQVRLIDLYADGFDPTMSADEHLGYEDVTGNTAGFETYIDHLHWCEALIFVYPTWWYGLPAMMKGWLDRVLVPGVAFHLPDDTAKDIRPGLTHITRLGLFTTCGASWWLTRYVGAPGKRTLLRGIRLLCAPRCKVSYAAHYRMDSSTAKSRARHLSKVARKMDRLIGGAQAELVEARQ